MNPSNSKSNRITNSRASSAGEGRRRCQTCSTTTTSQWRYGGSRSVLLCNACGIRWRRRQRNITIQRTFHINSTRFNSYRPYNTVHFKNTINYSSTPSSSSSIISRPAPIDIPTSSQPIPIHFQPSISISLPTLPPAVQPLEYHNPLSISSLLTNDVSPRPHSV